MKWTKETAQSFVKRQTGGLKYLSALDYLQREHGVVIIPIHSEEYDSTKKPKKNKKPRKPQKRKKNSVTDETYKRKEYKSIDFSNIL